MKNALTSLRFAFFSLSLIGGFAFVSHQVVADSFETGTIPYSLTTDGTEEVAVWVKGTVINFAENNTHDLRLFVDGVQKDIVSYRGDFDGNNGQYPFALMYTETPIATTTQITVTPTSGSVEDVVVMVERISASGGGGGGSTSGTTTIESSSFDTFNLWFGMLLMVLSFWFVVWYFKPIRV